MKGQRVELNDDMMATVSGGLTADPGSKTLGYSSSSERPYKYESAALITAYVNLHIRDREWKNGDDRDAYLIAGMLEEGLITKI